MAPNQNNCAVMLLDTLSSSTSLQNFPRSLPLTNTEPQLQRPPPRQQQQQDSERRKQRQLYQKWDGGDDVVTENNNEPIVAAFGDYMKWDDDTDDENDASQTMQGRFEDEPERSNPQHSETLERQFVTGIEGSNKNITNVVASPRRSLTQNTVLESSRNDPYDKNDFVVAAFGDYMDDDDLDDW